ncbi:MAG: hypothetical protein N2691_00145 [Patescibacteria group bacterium]|nr:hypothetical protein [Patescibacteria group bacterium]
MSIVALPDHFIAHRTLIKTLRIIDAVLPELGYERFEVPVLTPALIPESYLEIYTTEYRYGTNRVPRYLSPSPELYLKRLIAAGAGSCYALMRCYRNGEQDSDRHSGEFTMLELYKVAGDYFDVATDILHLFRMLAQKLSGTDTILYNGKTVRFDAYEKITVADAFREYAGIGNVHDEMEFMQCARKKGYTTEGFSYTDVWSQIYAQEVEPYLGTNGQPTILYEYPQPLAATAEIDPVTGTAKRMEIYIEGLELGNCGNASSDNRDRTAMEKRLRDEDRIRKERGMNIHIPDFEFADVLEKMPPTAGIALGVERLAMVFAGVSSIRDLAVIQYE